MAIAIGNGMQERARGRHKGRRGTRGRARDGLVVETTFSEDREVQASARAAAMDLRRSPQQWKRHAAMTKLMKALVTAEKNEFFLDGQVLGITAAHAAKNGLYDVIPALCSHMQPRMSRCGGREIAEVAAAAAKAEHKDPTFFNVLAKLCSENSLRFDCLRDVCLVASALLKVRQSKSGNRSPAFASSERGKFCTDADLSAGFVGLVIEAIHHLQYSKPMASRDVAEFFHALGNFAFHTHAGQNGLCNHEVIIPLFVAATGALRPCLPDASPQDIAKLLGGAAALWQCMFESIAASAIDPFVAELAQSIRFRVMSFTPQDLSMTVVAYAKLGNVEDLSTAALCSAILQSLPKFSQKDFTLVLWSCSQSQLLCDTLYLPLLSEMGNRDLTNWLVVDICMSAHVISKIGRKSQVYVHKLVVEAVRRNLEKFRIIDVASLLWSMAKSRVVETEFCRLIIQLFGDDGLEGLNREALSNLIWSLAVIWPQLIHTDTRVLDFLRRVCSKRPWQMAPINEVTSTFWAFTRLPKEITTEFGPALVISAYEMEPASLSMHDLCNILYASGVVTEFCLEAHSVAQRFADQILARIQRGIHIEIFERNADSLKDMVEKWQHWSQMPLPVSILTLYGYLTMPMPPPVSPVRPSCDFSQEVSDEGDFLEQPAASEAREECVRRCEGKRKVSHDRKRVFCNSTLRLNQKCDFAGHCLQLKHTFLHMECKTDLDEDCDICKLSSRIRSKSADDIELHREIASPLLGPHRQVPLVDVDRNCVETSSESELEPEPSF